MGAFLFKYRLTVMLGAFGLALGAAFTQKYWADTELIWLRSLARWTSAPWGRTTVLVGTGIILIIAFLIRTASEARLKEDVYGQGKSAQLLVNGTFAWLRNPLYLGTWLFFLGAVLLWAPAVLALGLSIMFFLFLHAMIRHEETLLSQQFGEAYGDYCRQVRRWLPLPPSGRRSPAPSLASFGWAALGNLGLLSLGLFRIAVAAGAPVKPAGAVNLALLGLWLGILGWRRFYLAKNSTVQEKDDAQ